MWCHIAIETISWVNWTFEKVEPGSLKHCSLWYIYGTCFLQDHFTLIPYLTKLTCAQIYPLHITVNLKKWQSIGPTMQYISSVAINNYMPTAAQSGSSSKTSKTSVDKQRQKAKTHVWPEELKAKSCHFSENDSCNYRQNTKLAA